MSNYLRAEIVESLRRDDTVFIIGAGVSILASEAAPTASWIGLIEDGMTLCVDLDPSLGKRWISEQKRELRRGETASMTGVAQSVESELKKHPGNYYAKWLSTAFRDMPVKRPGILQVLADSGSPLFTTNYDTLLESVSGRIATTWQNVAEIQEELSNPGRYVVHLHGQWRAPDSVVFGYESYAKVIGDSASQALIRAMATVKSIVFVGFGKGLEDPNFSALTTWLTSVLPTGKNAPIALVRSQDHAKLQGKYRQAGINVVSYGSEYQDLELYIADLANEAKGPIDSEDVTVLGWDLINSQLARLHRRITRDFHPDFIVAMSGPGNVAPAYCLRHFSDDPPLFSAVTFPRRPGRSKRNIAFEEIANLGEWIHYPSDKWDVFLPNLIRAFPPGSRALIFDDRVIGGRVQAGVSELLTKLGYEVKRAALVVHPDSADHVDFYEQVIKNDFCFPWGGKYGRGEPPS
ncbi:SIR2 family protein [Streptomyces chartreusis]|uniref:SIR2 family protein n=1 Tax=Streptomyces chartreusis TaxID=1969 RepID=UPI00366293AF